MQRPSLAQLQQQVRSDNANVRQSAMLAFGEIARRQPHDSGAVLPIFLDAIQHPRDGWTTAHALRGFESLRGSAEGLAYRIPLYQNPNANMACPAIVTAPDTLSTRALIAALEQQQNPKIRISILQAFTRLRDPATVLPTIQYLEFPVLRPYAIETLGYLGDPQAIPHLEKYRGDNTPTWPIDNHGPMMTVGSMAGDAIGQIQFFLRGGPNPQFARTAAPPPPIRGPLVARLSAWSKILAFVPLTKAVVTLPWIFILVILSLDKQGHTPTNPDTLRGLDVFGAIPAALGLFVGALVTLKVRPLRTWQWILLTLGLLACVFAILSFTWEFAHERMI